MNGISVTQNHAYHNYVFDKYLSEVKFLFITSLGLLCNYINKLSGIVTI